MEREEGRSGRERERAHRKIKRKSRDQEADRDELSVTPVLKVVWPSFKIYHFLCLNTK